MAGFARVLAELTRHGLLLLSDKTLPSVTTLVAGAPLRGSWWGHEKGRAIYRVQARLSGHPDVIAAKLVNGKVTFVHRKLWPALAAVAMSRQPRGVSAAARALWNRVQREGTVRASGDAARELESGLLVYATEIHTERGRHEKMLESWKHWARRMGLHAKLHPKEAAEQLAGAVARLERAAL